MSQVTILSLGAGVQSSVMALMAERGELGHKVDAAVFADTQAEPPAVYDWLSWLEGQLSFPVIRATAGDLGVASTTLKTAKSSGRKYIHSTVPAFTVTRGKIGVMTRQCTADYKIDVVRRATRKVMGERGVKGTPPGSVCMLIGISTDEASRMKDSRVKYIRHVWPLIDLGMSRQDCLEWAAAHGLPAPPRSACVFCPYHSNEFWRELRAEDPASFAAAVDYEKRLQAAAAASDAFRADSI